MTVLQSNLYSTRKKELSCLGIIIFRILAIIPFLFLLLLLFCEAGFLLQLGGLLPESLKHRRVVFLHLLSYILDLRPKSR